MKHVFKNLSSRFALLAIMIMTATIPMNRAFANLDANDPYLNSIYVGGAYVVFAGKSGGEIKKSEITGQTEVRVDGCAKGYKIMHYTLEITSGKIKSTYRSDSNLLTKEIQSKLQRLEKGDTFEFKLMKAQQHPDKHTVDVQGSKFTIV